jgi:hypothetical protein
VERQQRTIVNFNKLKIKSTYLQRKTHSASPEWEKYLGGPVKVCTLTGMSMKKLCDFK